MRENNRNSIEKCRKKLPQFTTMNVIDGQAGLVNYFSLIFYSLTIDNILNIIVLLILAAVSIAMLTGENGILTQANRAKSVTKEADIEERKKLAQAEANLNMEETEYTAEDGTVKIPAGMAPTKIEGENAIKDGLVAVDKKGNSWVWIEVPKSITESATSDSEIETALQGYATDYRESGCTDEWYDGSGKTASTSTNLEDKTGCGLTSSEYALQISVPHTTIWKTSTRFASLSHLLAKGFNTAG